MAAIEQSVLRDNLAYLALAWAIKGETEKSERLRRVVGRIDAWRESAASSGAASYAAA